MLPNSRCKLAALLVAIAASTGTAPAQPAWGVHGTHLTLDGQPTFLSGVNYVPSKGWLTHIGSWDRDAVDRDLETLRQHGVRSIRYLPLWHQLQPDPEGADATALARVSQVIDLAEKHGIFVQLGILNIWMSGGVFLPPWADGNIFTEPAIIAGELSLARDVAARYSGRRILQGFDLGNELNVLEHQMKLALNPQDIERWQERIVAEVRRHAPGSLIVNGVGTGYSRAFNIESLAGANDFMAAHSYPYFHGTSSLDPWLGQRTTYSTNYIISWAAMTGKPVVMQELGASEQWVQPATVPKYLRLTLLSNWLEGAAGYLWWCSHDLPADFAVADEGLFKEYSVQRVQRENKFGALNYDMGLLDNDNRPKPAAAAFRSAVELVERIGVDWENRLPACYILVPEDSDYEPAMIQLITPFALAKQAHMDVKFVKEGRSVPRDAAALVIPGFALSPNGREQVSKYLHSGGTVYQSYFKDFGDGIQLTGGELGMDRPRLAVIRRAGAMEVGQQLQLAGDLLVREASVSDAVETLLAIRQRGPGSAGRQEADTSWFRESEAQGILFRARHGAGTYYYLAANLDAALTHVYDPWESDDSHLIYSALRPEHAVNVDSKYVELHHKTRGGEELVAVLNHSAGFVDALLSAGPSARLVDAEAGEAVGNTGAEEVALRLAPAEVLLMYVERD